MLATIQQTELVILTGFSLEKLGALEQFQGGFKWITMMKNLHLRTLYAILLQIEYVLALITGVLLGASCWIPFIISLVLVLLLGFVTTAMYWHLMDITTKG